MADRIRLRSTGTDGSQDLDDLLELDNRSKTLPLDQSHRQNRSRDVFATLSTDISTNPPQKKVRPIKVKGKEWVKDQEATFLHWINQHLKSAQRSIQVTDLYNDLRNGLVLIELMKVLTPTSIKYVKYHKNPKMRVQQLENIKIAFQCMRENNVQLLNLEPLDIVDGNQKLVLGLFQRLSNQFPLPDETDLQQAVSHEHMLLWLQSFLPSHHITNLSTDWMDGSALSSLVSQLKPDIVLEDTNDPLSKVLSVMNTAEKHFQIPTCPSPAELCAKVPSQKQWSSYLSYYCCHDSPGHKHVIKWLSGVIPEMNVINFTSDWRDGLALSALTDSFLHSTSEEKLEENELQKLSSLSRVQQSMNTAEEFLGVKKIITPRQFISKGVDPLLVMAYITQFIYAEKVLPPSKDLVASVDNASKENRVEEMTNQTDGEPQVETSPALVQPNSYDSEQYQVQLENMSTEQLLAQLQTTVDWTGTDKIVQEQSSHHSSIDELDELKNHQTTQQQENLHTEDIEEATTISSRPSANEEALTISSRPSLKTSSDLDAIFAAVENEIDFDSVFKELDEIVASKPSTSSRHRSTKSNLKPKHSNTKHHHQQPLQSPSPSASFHSQSPPPESPPESPTSFPEYCKATGRGLYCSAVDVLTQFSVDCSTAGRGRLEIIITDPMGSKVDATGEQRNESIFSLSFLPRIVGTHKIFILFDGRDIPDSPYECEVCNPLACKAHCDALETALTNSEVEFSVETSGAGPGSLSAVIRPSRSAKLRLVSREGSNYIYSCTFEQATQYRLELKWAGFLLPGSPFTINARGKPKCHIVDQPPSSLSIGQPMIMRMNTDGPWPNDLKVTLMGQKGQELCNIRHEGKGVYAVISHPSATGSYSLAIQYKGNHIEGSPTKFEVFVPTDPSKCTIEPLNISEQLHTTSEPITFKVITEESGPGKLICISRGPDGEETKIDLQRSHRGFDISYIPLSSGIHTIEALFDNQPIPNTPLELVVSSNEQEEQEDLEKPLADLTPNLFEVLECPKATQRVGEVVLVKIKSIESWPKGANIFVGGPYRNNQSCSVNETADVTTVSFKPWKVGKHQLHLLMNEKEVPGFPLSFIVNDPSRCRVDTLELPTILAVDKVVTFTVSASRCGEGEIAISAKGPDQQSQDKCLVVTELQDKLWRIAYTPSVIGPHHIEVLFDGISAPSCPVELRVCNPEACVVSGHGLHSGFVNTEMEFSVDTTNAGPGKITAKLKGSNEDHEIRLTSRNGYVYTFTYVIHQPGDYQLELQLAGYYLKNSPYFIKISPLEAKNSVAPVTALINSSREIEQSSPIPCAVVSTPSGIQKIGEPVTMRVDVGGGWPEDLKVLVTKGEGNEEPCRVKQLTGEMFSISFTPRHIGTHLLHILHRGSNIPDSPIEVMVCDPSKCVVDVSEVSDRHPIDKPISFKVDVQHCGPGQLTAKVWTPKAKQPDELTVVPKDGLYYISYIPLETGYHSLTLFLEDIPLPCNPIRVHVIKEGNNTDDIFLQRTGPIKASHQLLDKTVEFQLIAKGRDSQSLKFTSVGIKTGAKPFTDMKPILGPDHQGEYVLQFRASQPDEYRLFISCDDEQIQGSPFNISVTLPSYARQVAMFDPIIPQHINHPLELVFDTNKAGDGRLTAYSEKSNKTHVPVKVEEIEPRVYCVSFLPTENDTYTVNVFWSDEHINGSPFTVAYEEQLTDPPVTIFFEPEMTFKGCLGAAVYGHRVGRQDVTVQQYSKGKYKIGFKPEQLDLYNVHVYWFDNEIPGSPFDVDLRPDDEEELDSQLPNQVPLTVGVNHGVLSAEITGRSLGPVPVKMEVVEDCLCNINFTTRIKDLFDLNLLWNGKKLSSNPLPLRLT